MVSQWVSLNSEEAHSLLFRLANIRAHSSNANSTVVFRFKKCTALYSRQISFSCLISNDVNIRAGIVDQRTRNSTTFACCCVLYLMPYTIFSLPTSGGVCNALMTFANSLVQNATTRRMVLSGI